MNSDVVKRIVLYVLLFLVIATVLLLAFFSIVNQELELFASIGGVSTLAIAIMTAAYVYVTSKQLSAMQNQLEEMKLSRELLSQPLLFFQLEEVVLTKPRLYYSPPDDEYAWNSLYNFSYSVRNLSDYPAVRICITAKLRFSLEGEEFLQHDYSQYFEALEGKGKIPEDRTFTFLNDSENLFIRSLLDSGGTANSPELIVQILFMNILGACFCCEHRFSIRVGHPKNYEDLEELRNIHRTLDNWVVQIDEFGSTFKNELAHIKTLTPNESAEWKARFDDIENRYAEIISSEDQPIDFIGEPSSYGLNLISEEEFEQEISKLQFPGWAEYEECEEERQVTAPRQSSLGKPL